MFHGTFIPHFGGNTSYMYELGGPTTKQWQTKRHKGSCRGVEFSPDGNHLVSVGKDTVIKLADSETGKVVMKDMEAHTCDQITSKLISGTQLTL